MVDFNTIEIEGIDIADYPDFADAFAVYCQFEDGTELTDDQLDDLANSGVVSELILDNQLYI